MANIPLVPERHILQGGKAIGPHQSSKSGEIFRSNGVLLMGHGAGALLTLAEALLRLAHFRALPVAQEDAHVHRVRELGRSAEAAPDRIEGPLELTQGQIEHLATAFEKTWQRADYWALALVGPEQIPATAGAGAYLDAAIGMEQVGRTESAHRAYRTALERWPDNPLAYSGLGNTAYALGDYAAAESAYRAALERQPGEAALWNNLAYALAAQGRRADSLDAIRRAIELEPDNPNFAASLGELKSSQ